MRQYSESCVESIAGNEGIFYTAEVWLHVLQERDGKELCELNGEKFIPVHGQMISYLLDSHSDNKLCSK